MARKIKIWNGAPEENAICRMSSENLANKLEGVEFLIKQVHKGTRANVCIDASDEKFKAYSCMTFDDLGVLYDYIQTLIYQCKEWKTKQ
jgi:hypothetical protein